MRTKKPLHAVYYMATADNITRECQIWGTLPDGRRVIITLTPAERKRVSSFLEQRTDKESAYAHS